MQGCVQTHMRAHFKCTNSYNYACKPLQIHISLHKHRHVGNMTFHAHVRIFTQLLIWEVNTEVSVDMHMRPSLYFWKYKHAN